MSGWISIHRKLQDHWLWDDKPFSKGQAWIDIILSANYKDNKFLLGNELIEVKRGSFVTSELKLMKKWGWSKTKVRSFLKLLEEDGMLFKKSDTKKTTLTIVNYSDYQDTETTERPLKDHEETAKELRKDTNNKDNKDNNSLCMYSEKLKEIVTLLQSNIGIVPPILIDEINSYTDTFNKDMFSEAIKIAANKKVRTVKYVLGILNQWQSNNILTINDLEALRKEQKLEREDKKEKQDNKKEYKKPNYKKTRFHNFEQRSDNYSNDDLEKVIDRKREEAKEKMKQAKGDIFS